VIELFIVALIMAFFFCEPVAPPLHQYFAHFVSSSLWFINGGLEQPNANWESPSDSAGSTGSAAGNGGKRYIRFRGQCGVIAQKL